MLHWMKLSDFYSKRFEGMKELVLGGGGNKGVDVVVFVCFHISRLRVVVRGDCEKGHVYRFDLGATRLSMSHNHERDWWGLSVQTAGVRYWHQVDKKLANKLYHWHMGINYSQEETGVMLPRQRGLESAGNDSEANESGDLTDRID